MVQIGSDTYEDLTPASFEALLDGFAKGTPPNPGSQIGRTASCPEGGPTTLSDPALFDGSRVGHWQKRLAPAPGGAAPATPAAPSTPPASSAPPASAAPASTAPVEPKPAVHPAALAAMANAGIVKELEERSSGGKPIPAGELASLAQQARLKGPAAYGAKTDDSDGQRG
jgi:NADH-quinone oxidoreductase subunit E